MIQLALIDDHRLFREGLASLLGTIPEFQVLATFSNGKELMNQFPVPAPDLVLLDINMPEMDGFATIEFLKQQYPNVRIILISMLNDFTTIDKALKLGVNGFLPKDADKTELDLAIRTVAKGEDYFHHLVATALIRGHQSPHIEQSVKLTPREIDILKLIVKGLKTHEIADKLFLSTNTVETHRKNLLSKTGCKSSTQLVSFAFDNNLLD